MKLRSNLFIFFGSLILSLVIIQWWVITNLDKEIRHEISEAAYEASRNTAAAMELKYIKNKKYSKDHDAEYEYSQWEKKYSSDINNAVYLELDENQLITQMGPELDNIIDISTIDLEESISEYLLEITYSMVGLLIVGLILAGIFSHKLSVPLEDLALMAENIGKGQFNQKIKQNSNSIPREVKTLISRFNTMSEELEKLSKKNRKLQEKQQLNDIGEIARGFAHSLRNPLNTIGLSVDELVSDTPDDSRKQDINKIVIGQLDRIDGWVKKFMLLSASEGFTLQAINLQSIINELLLQYKLIKPDVVWNFEQVPLDQIAIIKGLEQEIITILEVILENAIEAMDSAGEITIILKATAQHCEVIVIDEGKGIAEEMKNQVFSPGVSNKKKGFGMGLYIARSLARSRYDGNLELFNNTKQQGAIAKLGLSTIRSTIKLKS